MDRTLLESEELRKQVGGEMVLEEGLELGEGVAQGFFLLGGGPVFG